MKKTGIIIELENGKIKEANYGVITLARAKDTELYAIVTGWDAKALQKDLESHGVSKIVNVSLEPDQVNNPVIKSKAFVKIIKECGLTKLFGLSTAAGKDLLPRIAAQIEAPLVMDCVKVDSVMNVAETSQYSGKTVAKIKVSGKICVYGVRANAVEPLTSPVSSEIVEIDGTGIDSKGFRVIKSGETEKSTSISLGEADVIIAGGRGLANSENFAILEKCAEKLNASVGASRVAVDSGWVPYSMQIGQTGEKVSPGVYIACGISGSIQHYAGMKTSGMVIAINTDENASIISNSDYYAVADAMDVVTELTKLLEND